MVTCLTSIEFLNLFRIEKANLFPNPKLIGLTAKPVHIPFLLSQHQLKT